MFTNALSYLCARAHKHTHARSHTSFFFLTPCIQNIICLLTHESNHNSLSGFLVWLPSFHSLSLMQYKPSRLHLSPALFIFQALWKLMLLFFLSIIQGKYSLETQGNSKCLQMESFMPCIVVLCMCVVSSSQFLFIPFYISLNLKKHLSMTTDGAGQTSTIFSYLNTHGAVSKELLLCLSLSSDNIEHQAKTITCKCISSVKAVLLMSADSNIDNSKS